MLVRGIGRVGRLGRIGCAAVLTVAAVAVTGGGVGPAHAASTLYNGAISDLPCQAGDLPETMQGRVSAADISDGRAAKGYTCNTQEVSSYGTTGGFRVERYDDAAGHICAYYDSTLLFPKDAGSPEGPGTYVMDLSDPTHPVNTDILKTPAMLSPHESLRVNKARGLLASDMGYPTANPGFVDIYDIKADCRHPVLDSSTPLGVLGHESGFAPDGKTFYVTANSGRTMTALDVTDPALPSVLAIDSDYIPHGVEISDDGNRMYLADDNYPGLVIIDTSQIQARVANPKFVEISRLTWDTATIPQIAIPITVKGHPYVVEDDEYAARINGSASPGVGAARIIDIGDEKKPVVVSNIRLAVHTPANHSGDEANDPGAESAVQGYAAHYCSVPTRVDPTIMACSMILSGLRLFDIRDPLHPVEIGYFNAPVLPGTPEVHEGAFAMSSPNYDLKNHEIWYSDGNSGFYVVRLTGAAATIAGTGSNVAVVAPPTVAAAAGPSAAASSAALAVRPAVKAVVPAPKSRPVAHRPRATPRQPVRTLAFTGLAPILGLTAAGFVAAGLLLTRRKRLPAEPPGIGGA